MSDENRKSRPKEEMSLTVAALTWHDFNEQLMIVLIGRASTRDIRDCVGQISGRENANLIKKVICILNRLIVIWILIWLSDFSW